MEWFTGILVSTWNLLPGGVKAVASGVCQLLQDIAGVADKLTL